RRLVHRAPEVRVAPATLTAGCRHGFGAGHVEIGDNRPRLVVGDDGARRDRQPQVCTGPPGPPPAGPWPAILGAPLAPARERVQRAALGGGEEKPRPTASTIAPVWAATRHVGLSAERNGASAAAAGADVDTNRVYKGGGVGGRAAAGRPRRTRPAIAQLQLGLRRRGGDPCRDAGTRPDRPPVRRGCGRAPRQLLARPSGRCLAA